MGAPGMEMMRSQGQVSGSIPGWRTRSWRKVGAPIIAVTPSRFITSATTFGSQRSR